MTTGSLHGELDRETTCYPLDSDNALVDTSWRMTASLADQWHRKLE